MLWNPVLRRLERDRIAAKEFAQPIGGYLAFERLTPNGLGDTLVSRDSFVRTCDHGHASLAGG